jgi:outer membrane immunogenic protein
MKRTLSLAIGVLTLAGATLPSAAAELGRVMAAPIGRVMAAPIAVYNWTSCYIGGNLGGKWGRLTGAATATGFPTVSFPNGLTESGGSWDSSLIAGGQIGCQWQSGNFVYGIEGEIDGADIGRSFTFPSSFIPPPAFPFIAGDSVAFRSRWQASIRGRLGYAWDRWLLYATGGVALANINMSVGLVPTAGFPAAPTTFSEGGTVTGGTVGAGFDYAFNDYASVGMEYRYSKYGHRNFFGAAPFPIVGPLGVPATTPFAGTANLETHEITARLTWHFNIFGPGPLTGRYY